MSLIDERPYKADLMAVLGAMADCAHETMRSELTGEHRERQVALMVRLDHLQNEFALRWHLTSDAESTIASLRAQLATRDTIEQELRDGRQRLTGELVDARKAKAKAERQNREHVETIAILRGDLARANGTIASMSIEAASAERAA